MTVGESPHAERIGAVHEALAEVRRLLSEPTPSNVARSTQVLSTARTRLETVRQDLEACAWPDRGSQNTVLALRPELAAIAALLERAAQYHSDLLQTMVDASRSNKPPDSGEPATRLHLEV